MDYVPIRFINESIEACFDKSPILEKKPGCPDTIIWRESEFRVTAILREWHDYERQGRMARNMTPSHASVAKKRGSWGVGQDYYRIRTNTDQVFDIYYDRAPQDVNHRKGQWFIYRELKLEE
jgi:hypothetical protein